MRKIAVHRNPMRDASFLCWDIEAQPYMDGLGRPLLDRDGQIKMQLPRSFMNHDLPHGLAEQIAATWNKWIDATQTLEGVKEFEPERPIWCHACRKYQLAKDVDTLVCRICSKDICLDVVPRDFERLRMELKVNAVPFAPDTRVGKVLVRDYFPKRRWTMLRTLFAEGFVVQAEYSGACQGTDYVLWHPSFKYAEPEANVDRYFIIWRGDRLKLVQHVMRNEPIELGRAYEQISPEEWARLDAQRHPAENYTMVWPNGDAEE